MSSFGQRQWLALVASSALGVGVSTVAWATDPGTTTAPAAVPADNSGRNVRDRSGTTLTATDQGNSEKDLAVTQKIRQEVVADDSLSLLARNVKIITVDGVVTLRGPVKSPGEKEKVVAVARKVVGTGQVQDQLEIAR